MALSSTGWRHAGSPTQFPDDPTLGTGATELLRVGQAVFALGGGLDYFQSTVFNYPTLAECDKVSALNAANTLAM